MLLLTLLRTAWARLRARVHAPGEGLDGLLAFGLTLGVTAIFLLGCRALLFPATPPPLPPLAAIERARLVHAARADSAAAFLAGRLFQQRLDQRTLQFQDEVHDAQRPVPGPIHLPDFPAPRP